MNTKTNMPESGCDDFAVKAANKLWVCDVSELIYHRTKLYLCAIIDIYARKVVGYEIGKRNCTRLIICTLNKAINNRNPGKDLVFHSDRGSTNLSRRFLDYLRSHGIMQSASRPHSFNRNKTPNQAESEFYAKTSANSIDSPILTGSNSSTKSNCTPN